jgi:hypothetical protein
MESRAAVFTSQPQDVEVYHGAAWISGSMLGWRHDADGGCQVWVRLSAGGGEPIWTALECLRLPERHLSVAPETADEPPVDLTAARRARSVRDLSATGPATRALPAVRGGVPSGRAVDSAGRRRAPDTGELPVAAIGAGRHRAPSVAGAGRHRAADTGAIPVVAQGDGTREMPRAWGSRAGGVRSGPPAPDRASAATTPEPDLLTRPMRLGDLLPEPRDWRLDDTLTGV